MLNVNCSLRKHAVLLLFLASLITALLAGCAAQDVATDKDLSSEPKLITAVTTMDSPESFDVVVQGNRPLTYTSVKQPFPLAVILYFPETTLENIAPTMAADSIMVSSIAATQLTSNGRTARIEIALKQDAAYDVAREASGLKIVFKKTAETAPPAPAEAVVASSPAPASAVPEKPIMSSSAASLPASAPPTVQNPSPAASSTPAKPDYIGPAWVNRIDFASEDVGKSTIVVGTTIPVEYELVKVDNKLLRLELMNTNIPDYRKRPLITTRFNSAVDRITPIQKPDLKNMSFLAIELREPVPYFVEQADNLLLIHFDASSIPPKPMDRAQLPDWQQVLQQAQPPVAMMDRTATAAAAASPGAAPVSSPATAPSSDTELPATSAVTLTRGKPEQAFTGEKIALDFYETDIKNVFRIIREVSGKNFAIDKDVTGKVTLTLDTPVPWDQVLDLVLRMNQLGMVYEGDIVRIATVQTLTNEQTLRAAQKAADQKEVEQVMALEPLVTEYIPVNYSNAQTEILPHINNILTKGRGSVTVDGRNNQLIVTDLPEKIRQAKEIVQRIDKVTPQVIIEARVVEVNSDFTRELGIDWTAGSNNAGIRSESLGGNYNYDVAMNYPATGATSSVGFNFSRVIGTPFVLNARLNAIETTGEGKIISSPKIVTLDNKKARIKQGLEYPYLERDDAGGSSVKFKNIDLLLEVTPHVTPDNRISMNILITKNDVDALVAGVPSLSTNEAETELLVNDGDTIVIGGIIKSSKQVGDSGFPGLARIPVLGWLFKTEKTGKESNELLIFITPRIVQLEQRDMIN
jgi:type IV pilus assembly protein PilQ